MLRRPTLIYCGVGLSLCNRPWLRQHSRFRWVAWTIWRLVACSRICDQFPKHLRPFSRGGRKTWKREDWLRTRIRTVPRYQLESRHCGLKHKIFTIQYSGFLVKLARAGREHWML